MSVCSCGGQNPHEADCASWGSSALKGQRCLVYGHQWVDVTPLGSPVSRSQCQFCDLWKMEPMPEVVLT